jgi:hypothetical protein
MPIVTKLRTLLRRVRIVTKSVCYVRHIRLSVCNSENPSGQISVKFNIGGFYKICRDTRSLLKIGPKYRECYINTSVLLIVYVDNSP